MFLGGKRTFHNRVGLRGLSQGQIYEYHYRQNVSVQPLQISVNKLVETVATVETARSIAKLISVICLANNEINR
jgi:hypothetical protein